MIEQIPDLVLFGVPALVVVGALVGLLARRGRGPSEERETPAARPEAEAESAAPAEVEPSVAEVSVAEAPGAEAEAPPVAVVPEAPAAPSL